MRNGEWYEERDSPIDGGKEGEAGSKDDSKIHGDNLFQSNRREGFVLP